MNSQKLLDKLSEKMSKEIAEQEDEEILEKIKYIEKFGLSFDEWLDIKHILDREGVSNQEDFFSLGSLILNVNGNFLIGTSTKTYNKIKIKRYEKYTLKMMNTGDIILQKNI